MSTGSARRGRSAQQESRVEVVGIIEISPEHVHVVGSKQFVPFSAHTATAGATRVFIHSQVY